MTVDWSDFNPHPHMALAQYSQGVPLARKPGSVASPTGNLLGGANANVISLATIDQPSFQMMLGFDFAGTTQTIPFGEAMLQWQDAGSGLVATTDLIVFPGTNVVPGYTWVSGPSRGDKLTLELFNLDPLVTISYSLGFTQVSHVFETLRAEQIVQGTVQGISNAAALISAGVIGSVGASVAASGTLNRLAMAWGGPAILSCDNMDGTVSVKVRLIDPGAMFGGATFYGVAGNGAIASMLVGAGTSQTQEVSLPNGPVIIREVNPSTTTAVQPTTTLTALPL